MPCASWYKLKFPIPYPIYNFLCFKSVNVTVFVVFLTKIRGFLNILENFSSSPSLRGVRGVLEFGVLLGVLKLGVITWDAPSLGRGGLPFGPCSCKPPNIKPPTGLTLGEICIWGDQTLGVASANVCVALQMESNDKISFVQMDHSQ